MQNVVWKTSSPPLILLGLSALAWREEKPFMDIIVQCVQCRCDSLFFFFLKSFAHRLVFVSDLAVSYFIGGRRFVKEVTGRAGAVRDEVVRASVLCRLCHPTC